MKTLVTILSICQQKMPVSDYEILITGRTEFKHLTGLGIENIRLIPDQVSANTGKLGAMMNTLAQNAKFDTVCLMDDDMILLDGWYEALIAWVNKTGTFDILSFAVRNTDGTRGYDNARRKYGPGTVWLMKPEAQDPDVFVVGNFACFRKAVWETVRWDPTKGFYQDEDLDWSIRCKEKGFFITHCPIAYVVHNTWKYYQYGIRLLGHERLEDRIPLLKDRNHYLDNGLLTIKEIVIYLFTRLKRKIIPTACR